MKKTTMYASDLKRMIKHAKNFVKTNSCDDRMNYIKLYFNGAKVSMLATNGHMVITERCETLEKTEPFEVCIKPNILKCLPQKGVAEIREFDSQTYISFENVTMHFCNSVDLSLIENFVTDNVQKKTVASIKVDAKKLAKALESAEAMRRNGNKVLLEIKEDMRSPLVITNCENPKNQEFLLPML